MVAHIEKFMYKKNILGKNGPIIQRNRNRKY